MNVGAYQSCHHPAPSGGTQNGSARIERDWRWATRRPPCDLWRAHHPLRTWCPQYVKNSKSLDWTLWVALSSLFSRGFLGSPFCSQFLWPCVRDAPLLSQSCKEPDQAADSSSAASRQTRCSHIKPRLEHTQPFCLTPISSIFLVPHIITIH